MSDFTLTRPQMEQFKTMYEDPSTRMNYEKYGLMQTLYDEIVYWFEEEARQ